MNRLIAVLALIVAVPAQGAMQAPITAQSGLEDVTHAVLALQERWASWAEMADPSPDVTIETAGGKFWKLGRGRNYHADTPYGHVKVMEAYSFGSKKFCFAKVIFNDVRVAWAIRLADDTVVVPREFEFTMTVDEATRAVDSYAFAYTLADGTKGSRSFGPPAK